MDLKKKGECIAYEETAGKGRSPARPAEVSAPRKWLAVGRRQPMMIGRWSRRRRRTRSSILIGDPSPSTYVVMTPQHRRDPPTEKKRISIKRAATSSRFEIARRRI